MSSSLFFRLESRLICRRGFERILKFIREAVQAFARALLLTREGGGDLGRQLDLFRDTASAQREFHQAVVGVEGDGVDARGRATCCFGHASAPWLAALPNSLRGGRTFSPKPRDSSRP